MSPTSRIGWGPSGSAERSRVLVANLVAVGIVTVFAGVSITRHIGFGTFSDDPAEAPVDRWYAGLLSDIGIGVWSIAIPAAFVAARATRGSSRACRFFVALAAGSAWLCADDLLRLHEAVIPDATGIPEEITFVAYGLVVVLVLATSIDTIRGHLGWVLAGSVVALGCSVVLAGLLTWIPAVGPVGSALKFLGIVNWTLFCVDAAVRTVRIRAEISPSVD